MSDRLLLFTRCPVAGKTKTRLLSALTPREAAGLHRSMTEAIVATIHDLQKQTPMDCEVRFTDCCLSEVRSWLGKDFDYADQGQEDLGARLKRGFQDSFHRGYSKVIAIGSDCPHITTADLTKAFHLLDEYDCVLGPALDGGYYLIGLRRFYGDLFENISWSTDLVFSQTMTIAKQLGLTVAKLRPLGDIDRPEDLGLWLQYQLKTPDIPKVSVIIPTLNEALHIQHTLLSLIEYPVEIIVVDGGSKDKTIEIAQSLGVKVMKTIPHRAKQMNLGATVAQGDILLFLHADTKVPPQFLTHIMINLAKPGVVAGAFLLKIAEQQWGLNLVGRGANLRSRMCQLPYGDQGIFLTKSRFEQVGKFPEIAIMEDFALIKKLQTYGKIAIASAAVTTSARRWQRLGVIKTTIVNQLIIIGYYLGIDPDRLAHWYRHIK